MLYLLQKEFEEDFVKPKMSMQEYLRRLQQWRDKYEKSLDSRPRQQNLDLLSHFLTDFQWNKFDEIEVPGQYTEVRSLRLTPLIYPRVLLTQLFPIGEEYESELRQDPEIRRQV